MSKKQYVFLLLITLSLYCVIGAFLSGEKIRYQENPKETKKEILKHIAINDSIAKAKKIMELDYFKCEMVFNKSFLGIGADEKKDFLWCDKKVGASLFVERRYQVIFVNNNGVVSDIYASVGLTGL